MTIDFSESVRIRKFIFLCVLIGNGKFARDYYLYYGIKCVVT